MRLGMIGLGRMGFGMSARLLAGGHQVVGFDPSEASRHRLEREGGVGVADLKALTEALEAPRTVWMMVPSGDPVAQTIGELEGLLEAGDLIVDGGNSNYRTSIEHGDRLEAQGLRMVDVGTSGGIWGEVEGYSLMAGGDEAAVEHLAPLLETLAPTPETGWARVGPRGAGHFVKMIHNGIEYGLMQAYAEGFDIFRNAAIEELPKDHRYQLNLADIAEVWRRGSVVSSWLLDLTAMALFENPDLSEYSGFVQDSGEGRWTIQAAIEQAVPAEVLSAALYTRFRSRQEHTFAEKILSAMRKKFGGHVERATGG